jgi:glycosyltransferase involved in cell wall biosynthesis
MKVAIYTLTRDRLEYTQRSFESLRERAGYEYSHLVIDNGSTDGTVEWLKEESNASRLQVAFANRNLGISVASNIALEVIGNRSPLHRPDLIVKMDNDCMIKSPDLLRRVVECFQASEQRILGPAFLLSPAVIGINKQPQVARHTRLGEYQINLTAIVGGLFHVLPATAYLHYRYPENLPYAKGQDDALCNYWKQQGGEVGYIDALMVEHMDGTDAQAEKYPEYFQRKWLEEKQIPPSDD